MNYAEEYYRSMLAATTGRHDVARCLSGEVDWSHWRSGLRKDLLTCLGGCPSPPDINISRGEKVQKDGYTRERIVFMSEPGLAVPAYLLVPDGAGDKTPTAVALHGHGFGVKDIVGLNADGSEQEGDGGYHAMFAVALAKKGFVVIAPELLGFGELRLERDIKDDEDRWASSCYSISAMLLTVGRTMAGVRVFQARRSIDALLALGYKENPVAMGISGGGLVCTYLSALDERVRACCISGFANTYRGSILAMHHCIDNFQPGLIRTAEMPDVLSLIAPRPMVWESGERDPIFPIESVLKARDIVAEVYGVLGAKDSFKLDRFDGEHQISGAISYNFLWNSVLGEN